VTSHDSYIDSTLVCSKEAFLEDKKIATHIPSLLSCCSHSHSQSALSSTAARRACDCQKGVRTMGRMGLLFKAKPSRAWNWQSLQHCIKYIAKSLLVIMACYKPEHDSDLWGSCNEVPSIVQSIVKLRRALFSSNAGWKCWTGCLSWVIGVDLVQERAEEERLAQGIQRRHMVQRGGAGAGGALAQRCFLVQKPEEACLVSTALKITRWLQRWCNVCRVIVSPQWPTKSNEWMNEQVAEQKNKWINEWCDQPHAQQWCLLQTMSPWSAFTFTAAHCQYVISLGNWELDERTLTEIRF